MVPFANQEENKSEIKTQLTEVYKAFGQNRMERGFGYVYMNRNYISSDDSQQNDIEGIENAGSIINQINGFFYTPIENDNETKKDLIKQVGVSAQEVMKVLPEAVTSDENGKLYVDYNALTVFLVETVKEQHQEIKLLHKTLEDNGLLK